MLIQNFEIFTLGAVHVMCLLIIIAIDCIMIIYECKLGHNILDHNMMSVTVNNI